MKVKAYLGRTMLARLLACLALITGLAAAGAPAQAAMLQAASQQVASGSQQAQPSKADTCADGDQRNVQAAARDGQARCGSRKRVIIYLPAVLFGPDRAYE
ncbi:MAG: hypothetical protein ACTHKM_13470 [Tsuneonella sp.]